MEDYRKMMKNISNNGESSSSQRPSCQCNCHRRQASFPPGYKFNPTDEELVINYLKKKVMNDPLPCTEIMSVKIPEVNLYRYNPEDLAAGYNLGSGEKNWYFFTPRDRKYPNGFRPNRAAGDGFWKATGADKWVMSDNDIVGYRKALVFYQGKPPKGTKTNWIMHEFRYNAPARKRTSSGDMKLDDWVLCRIYKKIESANSKSKEGKTTAETQIETPEFDETQIETPAFDETQIDQGGNTSTDNEPLSEEDDLERFLNHVGQEQQQHLSPPVPPFQGESLANHAQYLRKFEQDQDYYVPVPANETTNYGFQHQQQHEQRPPPQMVQQPVHVVSHPSMRPNQIPIIRAKQMTRHYPMEPQQQQNIPHQWTEEDLDQYFRLEQYWLQQQNNEEFGYSESLRAYFTDDGRYLEDVKDLNRHLSKDGDNNPPGGYPHNPHSNP